MAAVRSFRLCVSVATSVIMTGYCVYGGAFESKDSWVPVQDSHPRPVYPYRSYGDVVLFHFRMPMDVQEASFRFKANITRHCAMDHVHLYLKYGSFPVVNPLNTSFPDDFALGTGSGTLRQTVAVTDDKPAFVNITSPEPGDWFSIAFCLDDSERILQKDLFVPCETLVSCSLTVRMAEDVQDVLVDQSIKHSLSRPTYFRFMPPRNTWDVAFSVTECSGSTPDTCPLVLRAASGVVPMDLSVSDSDSWTLVGTDAVNCSTAYSSGHCGGSLMPRPHVWSYVLVQPLDQIVNFSLTLKPAVCSKEPVSLSHRKSEHKLRMLLQVLSSNTSELRTVFEDFMWPFTTRNTCWPTYTLKHIDSVDSFDYGYEFMETSFSSNSSINITTTAPTLLAFHVYPGVGIGGTLSLRLSIDHHHHEQPLPNVTVRAALSYATWPRLDLKTGMWQSVATMEVNGTEEKFLFHDLHIPFPEAGLWYLGLLPLCMDHYLGNESHPRYVPCDAHYVAIDVHLNASACLSQKCGKFGNCYQYVSDGFIFSSCACRIGYRGWGCTDDREALSEVQLIIHVLLLTLSNTAMIPAIVLAFWRRYFLEGIIYMATMLASMVYHTCDAQLSPFCLAPMNVLQFCDFLTAIAAFWITLMAMAKIPEAARHLSCTLGVLAIAVVVQYDRTGLVAFALPIAVALTLVFISWARQCYGLRSCYPERRAWLLSVVPGALLTGTGAVLYAFCETRANYPYVHSAWHAIVGVALLCVLPRRQQHCTGISRGSSKMSNYVPVADANKRGSAADPAARHLMFPPSGGVCCVP